MKAEFALAVLLSNPILDEITLKRIEHILKYPVDWNTVFHISLKERTTFIICKNLLNYHYFWLVPDSLGIVWNTAYIGNIKRNKKLLYYYNILQESFSRKEIIAIPCDGVMLLNSVYQDMLGVRLLHDIDYLTETNYLSNINEILLDLDFKKIYVNDKDFLINSSQTCGCNILYSKYENCTYLNCDFCSCIKENPSLFDFLINCMKDSKTIDYYFAQLIMLYLSVWKSWNGSYYFRNIRHYTYSRLIDLYLYKKKYIRFDVKHLLKKTPNSSDLIEKMHDIEKCLNFFKKEGYLT